MEGKTKNVVAIVFLCFAIFAVAFILYLFNGTETENDAIKFKTEYEALNGEKASGDNVYQTLNISKDNKVQYANLTEAIEFLNKGTGLIYFGFPNCPWCRGMLPSLLKAVDDSDLDSLLYVDMTDKRDIFTVENMAAVKTKDASNEYYELLKILDKYLDPYIIASETDEQTYETGEKRIYVPLIVAVRDGIIRDAITSPIELDEGQSVYDALTEKQKTDLEKIFNELIDKTDAEVCDEHC